MRKNLSDRWAEDSSGDWLVLEHPDGRKIWTENGFVCIRDVDGNIKKVDNVTENSD